MKEGFLPYYNDDSKILILGSFPSVLSRETSFYYGNPRNRFWGLLACIFSDQKPLTNDDKKDFLKRHKIALWDMVDKCEIDGSLDSNIRNYHIVDLDELLLNTKISVIILNGATAHKFFLKKYKNLGITYFALPSTSPANVKFDRDIWEKILSDYIKDR